MDKPEDEETTVRRGGSVMPEKRPADAQRTGSLPGVAHSPASPPAPERGFSIGELIAGRFKIVRFIAKGGMGEVYEAEDQELRERVALKTIRPDIAQDIAAMERFRREIQMARKVTHPNVCRVFDLFRHQPRAGESGPEGEITFLSMELLEGASLAQRLRERERMTTAEALPLVSQMAAALQAAHEAGIVHRDFKPENVMLVEGERGTRAVVTDFGVARASALREGAESLTATGSILGTPAYMAPEQIEGKEITPLADVYALGVVLYEMVTGVKPFGGESPLITAVKRLKEPPRPPRTHVPDLDARWDAVILKCLERSAEERFQSAAEVARALAGEEISPGRRSRFRARRAVVLSAAVAFLVAVAAGLLWTRKKEDPTDAARPTKSRPSVAVLGFKNLSGSEEAAWLSTALSEMLGMELAAGEKLRMIPGENVARTKVNLSLAEAESYAPDTLARIRQNLGADLVILGSYLTLGDKTGGQIRLNMRVQDTLAGESVAAVSETGSQAELFELITRAGGRVRERLGMAERSAAEAAAVRAALPSDPEATRLYSEGLAKLQVFDYLGARDLLQKAIALEPDFPLSHWALAEVWKELGYSEKAKEEAKKAFDLSGNLSREERLSIEARYRETTGESEKAIEIYRTLWQFFPDNLEYGLRLAAVQGSFAHLQKDARATVETLKKLPPPASEDPRIDLEEANVASDEREGLAAARRAANKSRAQGARLLLARARLSEALMLNYLADSREAIVAFEDAKRIYAEAGNSAGVAQALQEMAWPLAREDLPRAKQLVEESLKISQQMGATPNAADAMENFAGLLEKQGDLPGALKMLEDTLRLRQGLGQPAVAGTLQRIGGIRLKQGDLSGARRRLNESLVMARKQGTRLGVWFNLVGLAEVHAIEDALPEASRILADALSVAAQIDDPSHSHWVRCDNAKLLIEEGRLAEAEALARTGAEGFRTLGWASDADEDYEGYAQIILARSLLAQARLADAQEAIDRAIALLKKSESPQRGTSHRLISAAITAALIRAASGKPADASETLKSLETALQEAKGTGILGLQFEARLALGEIEMASGNSSAGRSRLEALEKEARAKGFRLIARKAAAAHGRASR